MQAYYAARASEYDLIYCKPERQADLRTIERWLPPRFAGKRVLEVASGTGYWTQFSAPDAEYVVALDSAIETTLIARKRVPKSTVGFLVGDAYSIPLQTGRFGAAFAGFWFSHVPKSQRRNFLLGLSTRLEPGANVVLLDNRYVAGSSSPVTHLDAEGNTYQTRKLADGSKHTVLKNFPSESEMSDLVEGFGKRPVFTTWDYYWALEYVAVGL